MPSRMTIGHLVETLTSKTACLYGGFGDCTAFTNKGPKNVQYGKMLTEEGYHSTGNQILYNGMTGEQLETEIYFGPTYYLRLKHMPKDKINYRARGPRTALTRQTVQGRANGGGLRIGEMDRDCLVAHGMSSFIKESMMVRGDEYSMAICNKTGCIAVYNESSNIFLSPMADGPIKFAGNLVDDLNVINISKFGRDFSIVSVPYAFKLLMQELQAMNVQMRIITEDNVDQLMSLTRGDDIEKLTGGPSTDNNTFYNVEQVRNFVKAQNSQLKNKEAPIIKEKTPEEEINTNPEWGDIPDIEDPYNSGTNVNIKLGEKNQYRFKKGDIVVFKTDEFKIKYKIIEFDPDEMAYITQAIEGPMEGKFRDSHTDELETPYEPISPDYGPDSEDNSPSSPIQLSSNEFRQYSVKHRDTPESTDSPTDSPTDSVPLQPGERNAFKSEELDQMWKNDAAQEEVKREIDDTPEMMYERDLGSAEKGKEEEAEKILETITSLNEEKTEGLNLLLPEEEVKEEDKKDDSNITKKIV